MTGKQDTMNEFVWKFHEENSDALDIKIAPNAPATPKHFHEGATHLQCKPVT